MYRSYQHIASTDESMPRMLYKSTKIKTEHKAKNNQPTNFMIVWGEHQKNSDKKVKESQGII